MTFTSRGFGSLPELALPFMWVEEVIKFIFIWICLYKKFIINLIQTCKKILDINSTSIFNFKAVDLPVLAAVLGLVFWPINLIHYGSIAATVGGMGYMGVTLTKGVKNRSKVRQ